MARETSGDGALAQGGVEVNAVDGLVELIVHPPVRLHPDDADVLARLLADKAREARS